MSKNLNSNSINVRIFYALKVAEVSKIPLLLMSNPGTGKTTTIMMYGELRNMDVVCLQGNAETAEAIHGYEAVPPTSKPGEVVISSRTRPSWMNRILENQRNGRKTILFLDEITTANEYVQSALLKLVFDRTCGIEKLPPVEECLIVSAGNYANNLSSSMTMLPPLMNRFMIYNISVTPEDLSVFLNKYTGAITGAMSDPMVSIRNQLKELDKQEQPYSQETVNKIGEYFETAIHETTRMLITKMKTIDLTVTDLKNIYGDVDDNDPNLYGFVTPRSLVYLRDVAVACYVSFGEPGIKSDNFKNMINGLCGIALTKERVGEQINIKVNKIGNQYYDSLTHVAVELGKLSSDVLPTYIEYFANLVKKSDVSPLKKEDLLAMKSKIDSMMSDKKIKTLKRPLEPAIIADLSNTLVKSLSVVPKVDTSFSGSGSIDEKQLEELRQLLKDKGMDEVGISDYFVLWNSVADTFNSLKDFTEQSNWEYDQTVLESLSQVGKHKLSPIGVRLTVYKRVASLLYPTSGLTLNIKTVRC